MLRPVITAPPPLSSPLNRVPPVQLVHLDDRLLVANKPAGLLCVPGRGPERADCLATRVQATCADALVVHRLDMGT